MITSVCQRWRSGRASYRPAGEPLRTADYEVGFIADDTTAKRFVLENHYSASYPAARARVGLYRHGSLVGVAVFSMPMSAAVLDRLPCPRDAAVELGRLVLLDEVPANGESWFIARCFRLLRERGFEGVVSHADPVARIAADGAPVFPGHARPFSPHAPRSPACGYRLSSPLSRIGVRQPSEQKVHLYLQPGRTDRTALICSALARSDNRAVNLLEAYADDPGLSVELAQQLCGATIGPIDPDAPLPWDFISTHMPKETLRRAYEVMMSRFEERV